MNYVGCFLHNKFTSSKKNNLYNKYTRLEL